MLLFKQMKFLRFHLTLIYFSLVLLQLGGVENTTEPIIQVEVTQFTYNGLLLVC